MKTLVPVVVEAYTNLFWRQFLVFFQYLLINFLEWYFDSALTFVSNLVSDL